MEWKKNDFEGTITFTFTKQEIRLVNSVLNLFLSDCKKNDVQSKRAVEIVTGIYRNIKDALEYGE